ncbi:MAG: hypothetical protein D6715_10870 [Calditrichaeota bacterium]|nr:MAG: hypothetical protein D6715_10870 [Calditrichota bacterium]
MIVLPQAGKKLPSRGGLHSDPFSEKEKLLVAGGLHNLPLLAPACPTLLNRGQKRIGQSPPFQ